MTGALLVSSAVKPGAETTEVPEEAAPLVSPEGRRASVRRALASAVSLIPSVTLHGAPAATTTEASEEPASLLTLEGEPAATSPPRSITSEVSTEASQEATPLVTAEGKRASLRHAIASAVSFMPSVTRDVERAAQTAEAAEEAAPLVNLDAQPTTDTTEASQEVTPFVAPEGKRASFRRAIASAERRLSDAMHHVEPSARTNEASPEATLVVTVDAQPAAETSEASQDTTPLVPPEGKRASFRRAIASAERRLSDAIHHVEPSARTNEASPEAFVTVDAQPAAETSEVSEDATPLVPPEGKRASFRRAIASAERRLSDAIHHVEPSARTNEASPEAVPVVTVDAQPAAETSEASQDATPLVQPEGKRASFRRAIASAERRFSDAIHYVEPSARTNEASDGSQEATPLVAPEGKRASLRRAIASGQRHFSDVVHYVEPSGWKNAKTSAPAASAAFRVIADQKLAALAMKQEEWGSTAPLAKAHLLNKVQEALQSAQGDLPDVSDSCVRVQGYSDPSDSAADNAWCSEQIANVALVTGFVKKMETTLKTVAKNGMCPAPKAVRRAPDGRAVADVFPLAEDTHDPKKDWRVEVWMQEGKEATQGAALAERPRSGSCGLVLGAGSVGALAVMDSLHLLFQYNTVVLLKMHPLRTYQEPFIRAVLAPLIALGVFDTIVEESGVQDAAYLVNHSLLCQLHVTGNTETHDAIVWGPRPEREGRRQRKEPVLDLGRVTVTSKLGCITPYMICPAVFTEAELHHHAQHLATTVAANNSYSCSSPKVLLLAEDWDQREAFIDKLRDVFRSEPNPPAYYPGSDKRYAGFASAYSTANLEKIEGPGFAEHTECPRLPWTLVHTTADASNLAASANEYAFASEAFCPVLTVCVLKGTCGAAQYLEAATTLCNDHIWGSLSCSLIVHPALERFCSEDVEKAIANLEYGTVVLNSWSGEAYGMNAGVWGGYAGGMPALEQVANIQSGSGMVNNCLLFDHPAKAVLRAPFLGATKLGCGKPLTRTNALNLTNHLINPGILSKAKIHWPRAFCCSPR